MQKALAVGIISSALDLACARNCAAGVLGRARRNNQTLLRRRREADRAIYGRWFLQDASRGGEFIKDDQNLPCAVNYPA